jgi:uncharacterized protein
MSLNSILTPEQDAAYADPQTIQRLLRDTKTVALVGLSKDPQKASHFVATYLQSEGYRVIPVNPTVQGTLLGETVYPTLLDIPEDVQVDLVDVFRGASHAPEIARQAAQIGAKALWLQLRIVSDEAAELARDAGLDVVMDRCVKMEHGRYAGSLHWVGMNTGILTARKARR